MKHNKTMSGFTLVELLVVIGIIALLISILLPSLNRARAQAAQLACQANLKTIGQSMRIYASSHKDTLPYGYWDETQTWRDEGTDWASLLMSSGLGRGQGGVRYSELKQLNISQLQKVFACTTAVPPESLNNSHGRLVHYGSHPRLIPNLHETDQTTGKRPANYKVSKIKRSAEIAMIWDATQLIGAPGEDGNARAVSVSLDDFGYYAHPDASGRTWNFLLDTPRADGKTVNLDLAVWSANKDWKPGDPYTHIADIRWRHGRNDAANFLFADGHVEGRRLKVGKDAELKLRNLYVNPSK